MKILSSVVLLIFFSGSRVYSQNEGQMNISAQNGTMDTTYIENLSKQVNVFIYSKSKYNRLSIKNKTTNKELKYTPNDLIGLGIGFNYKWMGLSVAFNLPFINNDDDKYGRTKRLDASMNIFAHQYLVDVYFNYYKGFYIKNPEILDTAFDKSGAYPTIPSMGSNNFGFSYYYVINHQKFSYRAGFIQNEKQKKMAGSMIVGFITHVSGVNADSAFVPHTLTQEIEDAKRYNIKSLSFFDIGPMFGYAYNFVIAKKILISLSTVPGIVFQSIAYTSMMDGTDKTFVKNKLGLVISNRIALVYNGKKLYYGLSYNDFHSTHDLIDISTNSNVGNFKLFFGRRF